MIDASASGCINHPGIEASARCKQCGKPVCGACVVVAASGRYCSEACQQKNEQFMQRAAQLEVKTQGKFSLFLRQLAGKIVAVLLVLLALGILATFVNIPVLSELVYRLRGLAGI
jgi:hypothetical protein